MEAFQRTPKAISTPTSRVEARRSRSRSSDHCSHRRSRSRRSRRGFSQSRGRRRSRSRSTDSGWSRSRSRSTDSVRSRSRSRSGRRTSRRGRFQRSHSNHRVSVEHVRKDWDTACMVEYLSVKGFSQYSSSFNKQELDGGLLFSCTEADLSNWGLQSAHVTKLLHLRQGWISRGYLD